MNTKNTTEKSIKSPRFGVLDFVIILLIVVAVIGVYFRYNIIDFFEETQNIKEYSVSFSIKNIRYTTETFIEIGDKVYFVSNGEEFGTLTNPSENTSKPINSKPSTETFTDSKGEIVEVMYPNSESRIDAQGRMICSGRYSDDGGFLVNGSTFIASGQYVDVRTEYVTVTIRIDDIDPIEKNDG